MLFLSILEVAADPPPLSHADAAKIATNMGYQNVVIAYVMATPSTGGSSVVGFGYKGGQLTKFDLDLFYDAELGWFNFDSDPGSAEIKICTAKGLSTVTPAPAPQ
jgi:hypothetical protein